ncbi:MAG: response regulator [Proteobacteria bacterium]|nr:response regulator [Pseudomonadota bacterium]MBU1686585.1 response regulator [Pseudomonadota bacterium]
MTKKILVVDDEEVIRDMLAKAFVTQGYEVIAATDAEEALAKITPDTQVMFLDLKLPGMSGMDLCRKIRKDSPLASIYAMTGYASLFELADSREAGFDDYFTKPVKLEMLFMAAQLAFERLELWEKKA